jgi:hypothetical protein
MPSLRVYFWKKERERERERERDYIMEGEFRTGF